MLSAFVCLMCHVVGTRAEMNAGTATSMRHFALLFSFNHWIKFPPISLADYLEFCKYPQGLLSLFLQELPYNT